jgi:hypothetical protein
VCGCQTRRGTQARQAAANNQHIERVLSHG